MITVQYIRNSVYNSLLDYNTVIYDIKGIDARNSFLPFLSIEEYKIRISKTFSYIYK